MFENLSDRLSKTLKSIRGQGRLSEENISQALREVRMALLEADVALPAVKEFIVQVKERAIGQEVSTSLTPGQALIKIVQSELEKLMGDVNEGLDLKAQPPAVILLAGLQGAGKTTTVAKLARLLQEREGKKVMVASADVYRPAAIEQLKVLANEVEANFFESDASQQPVKIAQNALEQARKQFMDVLIIDTAGRLHIDEEMMSEIQAIHKSVNPVETLFVVDSMTGQDAANTAKAFDDALPLSGVILTKTDGDARGGAALSVRQITNKPIKFLGVGEKVDALEPFHPDRVASRILGMGDTLTLIEDIERKTDKKKAQKLAKKINKGKGFDLEDFRDQLQQMSGMGGVASLMDKLPGMSNIPDKVKGQVDDKQFNQMEAMINSMTVKERRRPEMIKGSRKRRIVNGSGTTVQELNRMLKQFKQMQKMMKKMKGGKMAQMMRGLGGGGGGMPGMPNMGGMPKRF
ncbi:MAG: signal recognition particle protein [Thiotrichales bacterium]|jgi:signal recognition particle subunit SRP54|nr:signal recognition particle protein [Thiotrichales bacterium]MBT3613346.1 signal recognition particle protein [Thiotrichales bacterium]MBT3753369.1 signal recognition particle protein [Thiotrichales bacterium]MBT3837520.1 signal recognition particle protein [Thiotrichales bacterium]MBT4152352.1 signal recognition particle protein [Thiotrichales bacterium]